VGVVTRIHLETRIAAPIERVFDLARDIDLHARSMAASGEEAVAGRTSGPIELGETVTWRARHFGRWWTLTSRITVVEPPIRFADEQASGPFARFEHTHTFGSMAGGTLMTDDWDHTPPFGPLGWLADRLVLARHMRRLLETRNAALKAEAEGSSTPT
jgi:ligand-binding SRPBCC domain-containing protein